jgi:hypothetical protein
MSITNLRTELNHNNRVYFTGDTVIGRLEFQVTQRTRIKSLKLFVNGWSRVEFPDGKIASTATAEENYMACELKFITRETYGDEIFLEPGDYSYKFEVKLPENLPSSFNSRYGDIIYNLDTVFEMPWTFNKRLVQPLTLINRMDLSKNFKPNVPRYFVNGKKVYGCCGNATPPVETKLTLNKNSFAIGEKIEVEALIDNKSPRTLKKLKILLVRTCTFTTAKKKNTLTKILDTADVNQIIAPNTAFTWKNVTLKVPFTQPSTAQMSKVIKIEYSVYLRVVADAFFSMNYAHGMIVTVGCVPCTGNENEKKPSFEIESLDAKPFKK